MVKYIQDKRQRRYGHYDKADVEKFYEIDCDVESPVKILNCKIPKYLCSGICSKFQRRNESTPADEGLESKVEVEK